MCSTSLSLLVSAPNKIGSDIFFNFPCYRQTLISRVTIQPSQFSCPEFPENCCYETPLATNHKSYTLWVSDLLHRIQLPLSTVKMATLTWIKQIISQLPKVAKVSISFQTVTKNCKKVSICCWKLQTSFHMLLKIAQSCHELPKSAKSCYNLPNVSKSVPTLLQALLINISFVWQSSKMKPFFKSWNYWHLRTKLKSWRIINFLVKQGNCF